MKRLLAGLSALLLTVNTVWPASDFTVEIGYFDFSSGPLTVGESGEYPIPEGTLCQILEDVGGNGADLPAFFPHAGIGDRLLAFDQEERRSKEGALWPFEANGQRTMGLDGYFVTRVRLSTDDIPQNPVFLRIWNAAFSDSITGYWDSPLYRIVPGDQQTCFTRDQMIFSDYLPHKKRQPIPDDVRLESGLLEPPSPNPFNPTTTITFRVSSRQRVTLTVYNRLGRRVETLVEGAVSAGTHRITFDGSRLASGLYFATLTCQNGSTSVQRLLLVK